MITAKIFSLLSQNGVFILYTEVTLTDWPDPDDRARLQAFLQSLSEECLSITVAEINYEQLPLMAKQSHCGILFKAHNITKFTLIEAKNSQALHYCIFHNRHKPDPDLNPVLDGCPF
ncbi:hypothetical protein N752_05795 [Desulforamulus aquiferis]|nr:hypothetical protein [Desulforamulus aquiferis]RYD06038.1 hypothetical protein N752_05795 [Desulforamulus aquiferis]